MRRFLIWSGLAVVIGLVLAVGGYAAYDQFYARFQPVTIMRNQGQIQRLLDEASWVSPGGGDQVVYVVGYRDSVATRAYERQEADRFRANGVDVRIIPFARPDRSSEARSTPNERATIAELWLNRDWDLYRRWTAEPSATWQAEGLAPADGNLARTAVVEGSRRFVSTLDGLMRDAGVRPTWPLVIWRDRRGFLKVCACADSRSWAFIRNDLDIARTVPDPLQTPPAAAPIDPPAPAPLPETPTFEGLPYPDPVIAPPVQSRPRPEQPSPQPQSQAMPRTGSTPARPLPPRAQPAPSARQPTARPARPATRPRVEPDTMFY